MPTSPITNCYEGHEQWPQLKSQVAFLSRPSKGNDWTYAHHPAIRFFDGRLHATWTSARTDEDSVGQRVMHATAEHFDAWSEPRVLAQPAVGPHGRELVLTAAGMHCHCDTLVAYYGQYERLGEEHYYPAPEDPDYLFFLTGTSLWAVTSRDGESWTEPVNMNCPLVPNLGPQSTRSGRLVTCGNIMFPYTEDPTGLAGWTPAGIYPPRMGVDLRDDLEYFHFVARQAGWPVNLCEGAFYQTDDGTITMMLRSGRDLLWVTHSRDDGATWSSPVETRFTDNKTKFHFGRWPDGRFYYVGCPDPAPPDVYSRPRLVLSLSDDGVVFDRSYVLADEGYAQSFAGMHKGGVYGYGHTMIHGGYLYVIFSIQKEQIAVLRTRCEDV